MVIRIPKFREEKVCVIKPRIDQTENNCLLWLTISSNPDRTIRSQVTMVYKKSVTFDGRVMNFFEDDWVNMITKICLMGIIKNVTDYWWVFSILVAFFKGNLALYSYKYLETRFFHAADWVGQMNDNPKALDQSRMTAFIQYEKQKGIKGEWLVGINNSLRIVVVCGRS